MPTEHSMLVKLRNILTNYFNNEELQMLCFDFGIDYDDFSGGSHVAKATEIVTHFERHGRISELATYCRRERLHAFEDNVPETVSHQPGALATVSAELPQPYTEAGRHEITRFASDLQKQISAADAIDLEILIWHPVSLSHSPVFQKRQDIYDALVEEGHHPRFVETLPPFEADYSQRLAQFQEAREAHLIIIVLEGSPDTLVNASEFCRDLKIAPNLLVCLPHRYEKQYADKEVILNLENYQPVFWYRKRDITACHILKRAVRHAKGKRLARYKSMLMGMS